MQFEMINTILSEMLLLGFAAGDAPAQGLVFAARLHLLPRDCSLFQDNVTDFH